MCSIKTKISKSTCPSCYTKKTDFYMKGLHSPLKNSKYKSSVVVVVVFLFFFLPYISASMITDRLRMIPFIKDNIFAPIAKELYYQELLYTPFSGGTPLAGKSLYAKLMVLKPSHAIGSITSFTIFSASAAVNGLISPSFPIIDVQRPNMISEAPLE